MPINIDPQFSVFRLVQRVQAQNTPLRHRRTMSQVSYEIENATLADSARNRIFSGFQYMSKFTPQVKRYTQMAAKAEAVYVFGVPDVEPPAIANVTYVPLSPKDQLAKECF
jgi:DICT domain-containing protein